ncbi:MAG: GTPase [Candidatus Hydrothermia bacterium]
MPANLPPQYFDAEKEYRNARTIEEKIHALKKMLAVMPKHKGTDKLQAEIRAKISKLHEEQEHHQKGKKSASSQWFIKKEGAGQVVLLGPTNSGKTTLLNALCNTHLETADYQFTTQISQVGMMDYEDIKVQIVDTPAFREEIDYRILELARNADLLVLLLTPEYNALQEFNIINEELSKHNIIVTGSGNREYELFGPVRKRAILTLNKVDMLHNTNELSKIRDYFKNIVSLTLIPTSALYGTGISELKRNLFQELEIIRVYTKEPGKPPVMHDPLILKKGNTVVDAAREIHKDFERNLKYAKVWGSAKFEGQRVEHDYKLQDKDIVEFHI